MTDYFFISSPLHFCLAANFALQSPAHRSVALIMTRDKVVADIYAAAIGKHPEIFASVTSLAGMDKSGVSSLLRKIFSEPGKMRIFTGNDRRYEFQYAMQIATQAGAQVEGIYLDDGAVSYVGHKSINKISHRYIDPLLKKLSCGWWWKNSLTTGASAWIDSAYVAFPDAVHPLLRDKKLHRIDATGFRADSYVALTSELVADSAQLRKKLSGVRVVLTLPHEAGFLQKQQDYVRIGKMLADCFQCGEIAVKAHPRAQDQASVEGCFPGALLLDRRIGMEFLLPFLQDDCLVLGDISTALLTSKWLRPDLAVVALKIFGELSEALLTLYDKLQVEITDIAMLPERLERLDEFH